MYTTNLTKIVTRRKKRVGRGYGSGVGHASTRGQKGQNARAGGQAKRGFTGDKNSLIRRLPVERGYGGRSASEHAVVVRISRLLQKEIYEIDLKSLVSIAGNDNVKLVGETIYDNLDLKKVVVKADVPVSKSLREKITAAGGKVEESKQEVE